jgi:hypothetical protein
MKNEPATLPECIEGKEASARFDAAMRKLLSVPHAEIQRRETEYRKKSLANPNRRGPKPRVKPSASARELLD